MKSGFWVCAAALAALSLWASPAMAQITGLSQLSEAQQDEMYCVADKLSAADEGFYDVAEAMLYNDKTDEEIKQAQAALKTASEACAGVYKWDAGKRALGEKIGIYTSVADYLSEELYFDGREDEESDLIFTALGKLPVEELNHFLDISWPKDAAFTQRLDGVLAAVKFPDDDKYTLEAARLIMEASVLASAGMSDWVREYINKQ